VTLTNRLTAFFLGSLGLVLVGFSATLYLLARSHLYRQADERLEAAAHTLVAAAEVEPEGVDWEPTQRTLTLGPGAAGEQVCWLVRNENGETVDHSRQPGCEALMTEAAGVIGAAGQPTPHRIDWQGQGWVVTQRQVRSPGVSRGARPDGDQNPKKHSLLVFTVAVPLAPVASTLNTLAATLTGLTLTVLALALAAGRVVCRRALAPVTRMAAAARSMQPTDWHERLPAAASRDELADLGVAFNGLLDRLEEAYERQRRFTGDASHQLRTPLAAVLGQVEVCLRHPRSSEEYRQTLERVLVKGRSLAQIVEMLLFLSRADAEAQVAALEELDLAGWVEAHLREWDGHPRRADLRLTAELGAGGRVRVQPALLGQLLDNLLDNALKYSRPGSPVRVTVGSDGAAARLAVEDEGDGIAPADLPHVFEPFFRSARARRAGQGGVGLGLAVARRIAAVFGGGLGVESAPGRGSRFELTLPLTPENAPAAPPPPDSVGSPGYEPAAPVPSGKVS
jgi:heavy metal sensor kinase